MVGTIIYFREKEIKNLNGESKKSSKTLPLVRNWKILPTLPTLCNYKKTNSQKTKRRVKTVFTVSVMNTADVVFMLHRQTS